ncbi:phosphomannomutase/phosphoglucomutase [Candidiatus Paracoxiella cheracis]|uniref:phosphomannomutase/phosphoglucomutase n=1 Tax=Candidiatus Paracoxiella cheracis TaxID=3405120 RepID=UPI003BF48969
MSLTNPSEVKVDSAVLGDTESSLFRTYDIRGPAGEGGLTPKLAYAIGRAVGSEARELDQTEIIVGRDGRLSGPELTDALIDGLHDTGLDVVFIGMVPTPLLYFATNRLTSRSGVMVTASHNPAAHNGFKIVLNGKTLTTDGIEAIKQRIYEQRFQQGKGGLKEVDIIDDYMDYVTTHIKLARPLKVVVDCGNGVAGNIVPELYRRMGCEVIELYCEVDGRFPNHHPDPTIPENLVDIIKKVTSTKADIGLAFDGDADRLGVITNKGEIIWPDRQMMLFSVDLLSRLPGSDIIFDVKCSRNLPKIIREHGGNPVMWRTGHSVIKAKLFEMDAPLAGEMSGHIFFRDEWFGFDDGIYVGARLLRILSNDSRTISEIFTALPNSVNTPELKLPMAEESKKAFMQRLSKEGDFGDAQINTIDGMRVEFKDGWGLIRPSNTSPYLILRFESDTEAGLERIKNLFREQLLKLDGSLELPF